MDPRGTRSRSVAAVAVTALILAGCAAGAAPSTSPLAAASVAPTAAPTASPARTPTMAPSPSAVPSASAAAGGGTLCAVQYEGCTIPAGTYTSGHFSPAFTFVIAEGMTNDRDWPDGGGVSDRQGGFYWGSGMTKGQRAGKDVTYPSTIEGFAAYLKSFKGFAVTEGDPTSVDGTTAVVLDVATQDTPAPALYSVKDDDYNLAPGEKARFILLEKDGVLVTFIFEAVHAVDFDAVVEKFQPILDSVKWAKP